MELTALFLRGFRNYTHTELELSPQLNQFYGANAQGKTNILEALYLFVTGRSFRTRRLNDLIRWGEQAFSIELHYRLHDIAQSLKISFDGTERHIAHNGTSCSSLAQLFGCVPGVIFAPDDQALIAGSPAIRRRFLDLHLAQVDPHYLHHLSRYYQALRQRNALLRQKALATIAVWEEQMAASAAYITEQRLEALSELHLQAAHYHQTLSDGAERLSLQLNARLPESSDNLKEHYRAAYTSHRPREAQLGYSIVGPQRDDLIILINSRDGRFFGSEGQKSCATMSLRLAERARLVSQGRQPILLIDDVGARLDSRRREQLYKELLGNTQCFLAAPLPLAPASGRLFHIISGCVQVDSRAPLALQPTAPGNPETLPKDAGQHSQ